MNKFDRTIRFALTLTLLLATMLTNDIVSRIKFEIEVYGMESRLDEYARYVSFSWLLAVLTVVALILSLEGIFKRTKEKETDEWLQEQAEADANKFSDTW
jgi:hypothetical protein